VWPTGCITGDEAGTEIECLQGTHGFDSRDRTEEGRTNNRQKKYLLSIALFPQVFIDLDFSRRGGMLYDETRVVASA
jgi:hypothetical protein